MITVAYSNEAFTSNRQFTTDLQLALPSNRLRLATLEEREGLQLFPETHCQ